MNLQNVSVATQFWRAGEQSARQQSHSPRLLVSGFPGEWFGLHSPHVSLQDSKNNKGEIFDRIVKYFPDECRSRSVDDFTDDFTDDSHWRSPSLGANVAGFYFRFGCARL